jgi:hypothetical protein
MSSTPDELLARIARLEEERDRLVCLSTFLAMQAGYNAGMVRNANVNEPERLFAFRIYLPTGQVEWHMADVRATTLGKRIAMLDTRQLPQFEFITDAEKYKRIDYYINDERSTSPAFNHTE